VCFIAANQNQTFGGSLYQASSAGTIQVGREKGWMILVGLVMILLHFNSLSKRAQGIRHGASTIVLMFGIR